MDVQTESVRVTDLGWRRREERDWTGVQVWERPDGKLQAFRAGPTPEVIRLVDEARPLFRNIGGMV